MRVNHWAATISAPPARAAMVLAVVGFAVAWVGTSPGLAMGINWDAAAYVADYASGRTGWSAEPWSSHYALGPVYLVGARVARVFGGTFIDGARLTNAVSLALACAALAVATCGLTDSGPLAAALGLVFTTAWGILILVFTLEDNLLFLPAGLAALALSLRRLESWRARDSILAGALVGAGTLMSWQAGLYLFPPLYAAVCLGGETRDMKVRARDACLLIAAMFGARVAWALVYWMTADGLGLRSLLRVLFSRPKPSFFPVGADGWLDLALHWRTLLKRIGGGVIQQTGLFATPPPALRRAEIWIGISTLLACVALFVGSAARARRRPSAHAWSTHLLSATLLGFMIATAAYVDLPGDRYKRYDFLPVLLSLLAAAVLGEWRQRVSRPRRLQATAPAALALIVAVQIATAAGASRAWHRNLPAAQPPGYHGHGADTWFGYMRHLRQSTPNACGYVFTFEELAHARYSLEIVASLWSELPNPTVLGDPARVFGWSRPLPVRPVAEVRGRLRGCEWLSDNARAVAFGDRRGPT